eukprot:TRINITY_DN9509_c0_g1_i8.p1 TRINITY_DN9509_c0_g1~~TRINITY_DN9509_c0_g1_i8.p1  ORF type:complete len:966 (+),score=192.27 TRINITY_DN9509_c0_g1_i8:137-3034(+)
MCKSFGAVALRGSWRSAGTAHVGACLYSTIARRAPQLLERRPAGPGASALQTPIPGERKPPKVLVEPLPPFVDDRFPGPEPRVSAYRLGCAIDIVALRSRLVTLGCTTRMYQGQVLLSASSAELGQQACSAVFLPDGCVICWHMMEATERLVLKLAYGTPKARKTPTQLGSSVATPSPGERLHNLGLGVPIAMESMHVQDAPKGVITAVDADGSLRLSRDHLARTSHQLSVSLGLAVAVRLDALERRIEERLDFEWRDMQTEVHGFNLSHISHRIFVAEKGLHELRYELNSEAGLLDAPDLLWEDAMGERLYDKDAASEAVKAADNQDSKALALTAEGDDEIGQHAEDFRKRTGMLPRSCYWLIVVGMFLRILGGGWSGLVKLEYQRYYVVNDLNLLVTIETATGTFSHFAKAFLFPFWGVIADRVSRRRVIVASCTASTLAVWLLVFTPSITALVVSHLLYLIGDLQWSLRAALLRDIFSNKEWTAINGGATGIKSRIAIMSTVVSCFMVGVGMAILWLGDKGMIPFENEYTRRKAECEGQRHCVPPGQYSWNGSWEIDGTLRLLMIMGASFTSLETLLLMFFLPETIRVEEGGITILGYIKTHWRQIGTPWNNLRVFATSQLRHLMSIRFLFYVMGSGGSAIFMSWYRRNNPDSFTMVTIGVATGAVSFLILFIVPSIVDRYGDLRAIWIPSNIGAILLGLAMVLTPSSHWYLAYIIMPLFGGTSGALTGFTPELMAKLIPGEIMGTFETGKAFAYDMQKAISGWPWLAVLVCSEDLAFPLDGLPMWTAMLIGIGTLVLTWRQLRNDPHQAIKEGRALEPYWQTQYAQGKWFQHHGGRLPASERKEETVQSRGSSVVGLYIVDAATVGDVLSNYLGFLKQFPVGRSLSVTFTFLKEQDETDKDSKDSKDETSTTEDTTSTQDQKSSDPSDVAEGDSAISKKTVQDSDLSAQPSKQPCSTKFSM